MMNKSHFVVFVLFFVGVFVCLLFFVAYPLRPGFVHGASFKFSDRMTFVIKGTETCHYKSKVHLFWYNNTHAKSVYSDRWNIMGMSSMLLQGYRLEASCLIVKILTTSKLGGDKSDLMKLRQSLWLEEASQLPYTPDVWDIILSKLLGKIKRTKRSRNGFIFLIVLKTWGKVSIFRANCDVAT